MRLSLLLTFRRGSDRTQAQGRGGANTLIGEDVLVVTAGAEFWWNGIKHGIFIYSVSRHYYEPSSPSPASTGLDPSASL